MAWVHGAGMRTKEQEVALAHPCYLAGETVHPRFGSVKPRAGLSMVLTVNAGYE